MHGLRKKKQGIELKYKCSSILFVYEAMTCNLVNVFMEYESLHEPEFPHWKKTQKGQSVALSLYTPLKITGNRCWF